MFKDFGSGINYTWEKMVMTIYKCDYGTALKHVARDLYYKQTVDIPLIEEVEETTERANIRVRVKEFSEQELAWWKSFGISKHTLEKYNVYSIENLFVNDRSIKYTKPNNPIYGYYFGKDNGVEVWKIYMPKDRNFKFLANVDAGLLQGFRQLKKTDVLIITKSMKDVMLLDELGYEAIAPNSETLFVNEQLLFEFKNTYKHIIVFYDNDLPGKRAMVKIRQKHPELHFALIPKKDKVKDISDYYAKYGVDKTKKIIQEYLCHLNEVVPMHEEKDIGMN